MTPEIIKKDAMLYPHEMPKQISNEAHFQRIWRHYREHSLRSAIANGVDSHKVTSDDATSALKFLGQRNMMSVSQYVLAKQGHRPDLQNDEGFQACERVLPAIGLELNLNILTAESWESQFWNSFDYQFGLTEIGLREELPKFISDPSGRSHAEALMEEQTKSLDA